MLYLLWDILLVLQALLFLSDFFLTEVWVCMLIFSRIWFLNYQLLFHIHLFGIFRLLLRCLFIVWACLPSFGICSKFVLFLIQVHISFHCWYCILAWMILVLHLRKLLFFLNFIDLKVYEHSSHFYRFQKRWLFTIPNFWSYFWVA